MTDGLRRSVRMILFASPWTTTANDTTYSATFVWSTSGGGGMNARKRACPSINNLDRKQIEATVHRHLASTTTTKGAELGSGNSCIGADRIHLRHSS